MCLNNVYTSASYLCSIQQFLALVILVLAFGHFRVDACVLTTGKNTHAVEKAKTP